MRVEFARATARIHGIGKRLRDWWVFHQICKLVHPSFLLQHLISQNRMQLDPVWCCTTLCMLKIEEAGPCHLDERSGPNSESCLASHAVLIFVARTYGAIGRAGISAMM